jgi:hypothetical protein
LEPLVVEAFNALERQPPLDVPGLEKGAATIWPSGGAKADGE